jgi:hypothetical protein
MSEEFTLLIPSCGPIRAENEKAEIIISWGAGTSRTLYPPKEECVCDCPSKLKYPPPPYDLTKCPSEAEQEDVFAWDCETSYEAEDAPDAVAHDASVRPGRNNANRTYPQKPAWVSGCKKCKCDIGFDGTIDWSYDGGGPPCEGYHKCDRAVYNFGFLRGKFTPDKEGSFSGTVSGGNGGIIPLGTFNLNNEDSGGPVKSKTVRISKDQIKNALFKDEDGNTCITLYVRCALDDCHEGISHCVIRSTDRGLVSRDGVDFSKIVDECISAGQKTIILCEAKN